jgi:integrase
MNRTDVVMALKLTRCFGLRLEEAITLRLYQIKQALHYRELAVFNTKGKYPRAITIESQEQEDVLEFIINICKNKDKIFVGPGDLTHTVKKSIEDWIRNHRDEFQNPERITNTDARQLVMNDKGIIPSTNLTIHGCRHAYANNNYNQRIAGGDDIKKAKYDTSRKLGHKRLDVTDIYLK